MPINPKSLANLTPGTANKPFRKLLTKQIQTVLAEYLCNSFEDFSLKMATMSPKDYVTAYIKLLAVVTPRKTDVYFDADAPLPNWSISVVPNPNTAP